MDKQSKKFAKKLKSAALVPASQIKPIKPSDGGICNPNIWLGSWKGELVGYSDDSHVLLCAGTRGGKDSTAIHSIMDHPGSLFFSSSKRNEVSRLIFRRGGGDQYCDGMGQKVGVLDCFHVTKSDVEQFRKKYNPLDIVRPDDPNGVTNGKMIANQIKPIDDLKGDVYFDLASNDLIACGILHVTSADGIDDKDRNLETVWKLLQHGDVETLNRMIKKGLIVQTKDDGGVVYPDAWDVLFEAMITNDHYDGVVSAKGASFKDMAKKATKQWQGVLQGAITALSFLDDPRVRDALSETTIDLARIKNDPDGVSFFFVLEETKAALYPALPRLIYGCFEAEMKKEGDPATGHRVLCMLDEFGAYKNTTVLHNMGSLAGYGIKLFIIVQNLAQLKKHYLEDGVNMFWSGCTTRIFFDVRDPYTAQQIKLLAGEKAVVMESRNWTATKGSNTGWTKGQGGGGSLSEAETTGTSDAENSSETGSGGYSNSATYRGPGDTSPQGFFTPWGPVSTTSGTSGGFSSTTGRSHTDTKGSSRTVGISFTANSGTSGGSNKGSSEGGSESVQFRPLFGINDVIDDYSKLNPNGPLKVLVNITGIGWIELERVNYWEHEYFYRMFSKDPAFDFKQTPKPAWAIFADQRAAERAAERTPAAIAKSKQQIIGHWNSVGWVIYAFLCGLITGCGGVLLGAALLGGLSLVSLMFVVYWCLQEKRMKYLQRILVEVEGKRALIDLQKRYQATDPTFGWAVKLIQGN